MNLLSILLQTSMLGDSNVTMIVMMVALFAIMYFFMIRPQQKKQKQIQEQRNALKVGDRIVTAGGVHGKIKEVKETTFVIEISEGLKITIEKSSVFINPEDTQATK